MKLDFGDHGDFCFFFHEKSLDALITTEGLLYITMHLRLSLGVYEFFEINYKHLLKVSLIALCLIALSLNYEPLNDANINDFKLQKRMFYYRFSPWIIFLKFKEY